LPYKNVFLTTMVSHQSGPSQHYIYWTIGGSRYLLSKAITRKIHVDLIGDNIWGGLPHTEVLIKCHRWKWSLVGLEFLGCYYNNFTYKEGCKAHTYKSGELGGTSHSLFTRDASKLLTAHVFMFIKIHSRFLWWLIFKWYKRHLGWWHQWYCIHIRYVSCCFVLNTYVVCHVSISLQIDADIYGINLEI